MARGRTHSRFPAAVAMKRRDPKSTVVPGTHEAFALAICSVKMMSIVDALSPFLARQLSVFRIPTSIVRASKAADGTLKEHKDLYWFRPSEG